MNKKTMIAVLLGIVLAAAAAAGGIVFVHYRQKNADEAESVSVLTTLPPQTVPGAASPASRTPDGLKITYARSAVTEWEDYASPYFTMRIPKGWRVDVSAPDSVGCTVLVQDPAEPDYRVCFTLKTEGYFKTQQAKDRARSRAAADAVLPPVLDPQSAERFYTVFNDAVAGAYPAGDAKPPRIEGFSVKEKLCANPNGGDVLRAVYTTADGKTADGIFTCTVIQPAKNSGVTTLSVYTAAFFTAPEFRLPNWFGVLNECLSSVRFTETFAAALPEEEVTVRGMVSAEAPVFGELCERISSAWPMRASDYDLVSQKQADAALGYERVYDAELGAVYNAAVGFSETDRSGRYLPITDEMYNLPVTGYIEVE